MFDWTKEAGYAGYAFKKAVERILGMNRWTEFTPNIMQGGGYLAKDAATFAYYYALGGIMHVEIFIRLDAAGTANNPIRVNGWPTQFNIASRAVRFPTNGQFLVFDASDGAGGKDYVGAPVTYYDDLAGFSWTGTSGRLLYGQTNSGAAITLAIDDEVAISASWRYA